MILYSTQYPLFSIFPENISVETGSQVNSAAIIIIITYKNSKGEKKRQTDRKKGKEISAGKGTAHGFKHFPSVDTPHGSRCPVCALPF